MLTWLEFSFVLVLPGWHDSKRLTGVLLVRTRDIVAPVLTVIARDDDRDFRSVGLSIAPRVEFDTYPVRLRLVEGTFHRMTDLRAVAPSIATAQQGTSRIAHDPHRHRSGPFPEDRSGRARPRDAGGASARGRGFFCP